MNMRFSMKAASCGLMCALALGMMPAAAFATGDPALPTPCGSDCTSGASVASHKCPDVDLTKLSLAQWEGTWASVGDDLAKTTGELADAAMKIGAYERTEGKKGKAGCVTPELYRTGRVGKYSSKNYTDKKIMDITIAGKKVTFTFEDATTAEATYEPFTITTGCHGKHSELVYGFKATTEMGKLNILALQEVYIKDGLAPHFKIQFFSEDDGNLAAFGPNVHDLGFPKFYKKDATDLEKANLIILFGSKTRSFKTEADLLKAAEELPESQYCKIDDKDLVPGTETTPGTSTVAEANDIAAIMADDLADGKSDPQKSAKKAGKKSLPKTSDSNSGVALGLMGASLAAAALVASRRSRA